MFTESWARDQVMQRHWPTDRQKYLAAESNMDILAPIWYFPLKDPL